MPLVAASLLAAASAAVAESPRVLVVRFQNEAITPVTTRLLDRAIGRAAAEDFQCLVVVLDTPGGLVDSTREMVKSILSSPVPIVVFVAPPGARAASAGVFVTMAAHVAAMAPGTTIGAAHPVPLGGLPAGLPEPDTPPRADPGGDGPARRPTPAETKSVNDTVAWARALAEHRGRAADWVERAVRESVAVPAREAVAERVVDLVADDLPGLLAAIDGRAVELPSGSRVLRTAGAAFDEETMWWGERALAALAHPNLALFLLVLGFYGVLFELYSPGWGVAGTLGVICLALSFFSLAVLPVRFAGLVLVALGLALIVAEAFAASYGALAVGGAVCLVLGGLMLVESPAGFLGVSLTVLLPFAVATTLITLALVAGIVRVHRRRVVTGLESQPGTIVVAEADFRPGAAGHAGTVRVHGEHWRATSAEPVSQADRLEIVGREGLTLHVRPADADGQPPTSARSHSVPPPQEAAP